MGGVKIHSCVVNSLNVCVNHTQNYVHYLAAAELITGVLPPLPFTVH